MSEKREPYDNNHPQSFSQAPEVHHLDGANVYVFHSAGAAVRHILRIEVHAGSETAHYIWSPEEMPEWHPIGIKTAAPRASEVAESFLAQERERFDEHWRIATRPIREEQEMALYEEIHQLERRIDAIKRVMKQHRMGSPSIGLYGDIITTPTGEAVDPERVITYISQELKGAHEARDLRSL